jgi:signal transduction histidine kinase
MRKRGKAASVDFISGKAVAQQKFGTQVLIRVSECFEFRREYQRDIIFLHDELTDLTGTFNEISDELMVQYSRLEEWVKLRTAELGQSRNAAQAVNESKTLFVANISHELRTPLNGILGMCAIALHEQDSGRVR